MHTKHLTFAVSKSIQLQCAMQADLLCTDDLCSESFSLCATLVEYLKLFVRRKFVGLDPVEAAFVLIELAQCQSCAFHGSV